MDTQSDKVATWLWYDDDGEEAARLYTSLIEGASITGVTHYDAGGAGEQGKVMTVSFELAGQRFVALNGGPAEFGHTEAASIQVLCDDQDEVDRLWEALTEGGEESQCGWLKDRYGVSWQIVPRRLYELFSDEDADRAQRAMAAMLQMGKLDIAALERAADGD